MHLAGGERSRRNEHATGAVLAHHHARLLRGGRDAVSLVGTARGVQPVVVGGGADRPLLATVRDRVPRLLRWGADHSFFAGAGHNRAGGAAVRAATAREAS